MVRANKRNEALRIESALLNKIAMLGTEKTAEAVGVDKSQISRWKRVYTNMLVRAIEVTTDKTSENVLNCTLTLREVIITHTKNVTVADKSDMQDGVSTSAVQNSGTKSTTPVNESVIKSTGWFDGLKGTSLGNSIGIQ
ncbi:hypothetical protein AB680_004331 [Escherichia coli]|nr:hypothetical protein [Escherichia coli]